MLPSQPTNKPSSQPSRQPNQPSSQPSSQPTIEAPKIIEARFLADGMNILVRFSDFTNQGKRRVPFSCSNLFNFKERDEMNENRCSWISLNVVSIDVSGCRE